MLTVLRSAAFAFTASLLALPALADSQRTILVLDGSGSMWGQIDGKPKISIAQEVVGELLDDLPEGIELGLTVYGHRRKGDCADIESLVTIGADTTEAIRKAVNAIKPKGKTPLSAAVLAAAEELKYTEDKATVILVSDGRETCDADPCEIGRRLEETGVDFTAHVVGFDVSEEQDQAQLRCLAENTGGEFVSASNATELKEALTKIAAPDIDVTFRATEGEGGPNIDAELVWTLNAIPGGPPLLDYDPTPSPTVTLQTGQYQVEVLRTSDEVTASATFDLTPNSATEIVLVLDTPLPEATVTAPDTAEIGSTVLVEWTGPDTQSDYIAIYPASDDDASYTAYTFTQDGSPLKLLMPPKPGDYEIRYILNKGRTVLATTPITINEAQASVSVPETAEIGSTVKVEWEGPDAQSDYIAIFSVDNDDAKYTAYTFTQDGSPLKLLMPPKPGDYEVRYILNQGKTVLATTPITITEAQASVSVPETAEIGSTIKVEWEGPNAQSDYIAIFPADDDDAKYTSYTFTQDGSPLKLLMPPKPGDYEIRYVLSQGRTILATTPITITEAQVSVSAPDTAEIGSTIKVEWEGPDAAGDYVAVFPTDDEDARYLNYAHTQAGSPVKLLMPSKPGDYKIRYILNQGRVALASTPITITEAEVSVSAPETAEIGSTVKVEWEGPDAAGDYVAVFAADDDEGKYINYAYTRDGSPAKLLMPSTPGAYEIRYVLKQGRTALASQPITIEDAKVSVSAPDTAEIGEIVKVDWEGPDAAGDYIAVFKAGEDGKYINYSYTKSGSPAKLRMPPEPGDYEIRYVLKQGRTDLATQPIKIEAAEASITAPDTATPGALLKVEWTGPETQGDYISVALPDEKGGKFINRIAVNDSAPVKLRMPDDEGEYEIRYVMKQGKTVLATHTIKVAAP